MPEIATYAAQVIDHIKESLLEGALSPGDPIRETAIAERLGISRGPVREALLTLMQEGLVSGLPQKAKHIRRLSAREMQESYEMGGVLEGLCIVRSLHLWDDRAMEEPAAVLAELERESRDASGLAELAHLDEAFHDLLLSRHENRLMARTARSVCAHVSKFLCCRAWNTLFSPQEFFLRHKALFDALLTRDPRIIQDAVLAHYVEAGRRLSAVCANQDA